MWAFWFVVQICEWRSGSWNSRFNLCTLMPLIKRSDGDQFGLGRQSAAPRDLIVFAMATVSSIGHVPWTDLRVNVSRTHGRYEKERILSCELTETAPVLPGWPICETVSSKVSIETWNKPVLWHTYLVISTAIRIAVPVQRLGYRLWDLGFNSQQWKETFPFCTTSRLTLRSTLSPIQAVMGACFPGESSWGVKLTKHLHLVQRLRPYTSTHPLCLHAM